MFRKITSNRPMGNTLWKEINKEFSIYTIKLKRLILVALTGYPKQIYTIMVISILCSICCFFMLPRRKVDKVEKTILSSQPVKDGMGHIFGSISDLKEIIELQSILDGLSKKQNLNKQDSLILIQIKERLYMLNSQRANGSSSNK